MNEQINGNTQALGIRYLQNKTKNKFISFINGTE